MLSDVAGISSTTTNTKIEQKYVHPKARDLTGGVTVTHVILRYYDDDQFCQSHEAASQPESEHIEGFPLNDVAVDVPQESWQTIFEEAIQIVNIIGDLGILTEVVKSRSFIVQNDMEAKRGFKVMMVDFALYKFREDYKGDHDWDKWNLIQDEGGAV
ncbi:hypothetical protein N7490_001445 [Penicillium lividum]|nr:hypothetical protein N7490_001445 [Penicillium lividum]